MQIKLMKALLFFLAKKVCLIAIVTFCMLGSSILFNSQTALADSFNCYESGNCAAPALSNSTTCKKDIDYQITTSDKGSSITVLSFHGGKIEPNTTTISEKLQQLFKWNRYDLSANATETCLSGLNNYQRLHITSTNFDEVSAVNLVKKYPKSVAIHGYSSSQNYPNGTICVGGANSIQIQTFIDKINQRKYLFTSYDLIPVNSPSLVDETANCYNLKGTSNKNIVNKNSIGMGLQLELSPKLRDDLVNTNSTYDALRRIVYDAVFQAMNK